MKINVRRICGAASAVAVLMGTGVLAVAGPASAQPVSPWPKTVPAAPIATVFVLGGSYTDGGSARPRITDVNNVLTVDMSSQHRPTATGLVLGTSKIRVTFPDVNQTFDGTLVPPGWIVWNNSTEWLKLPYVPDVINMPVKDAAAALRAAGFTVKTQNGPVCGTQPAVVIQQLPKAGAQADFGSQVRITLSNC